ncbi:MAG TPA: hypothetical protein PLE81_04470 [Brevundimonas sp.]|uniref:hypothetical protein n=1 Tax=Brevundimonas sp. TaxID=1871086 RepID=UPI002B786A1D|nr:hypothetical protein [Brevundimonas sp.]HRH19876.1 hypothetical protein [Brevundimonas sp.]
MSRQPFLILAGSLSLLAAVLHLAVIVGGPDWYRFFGAGEGMARMAERGMIQPTLITIGIVAVLAIWAAYAYSGAGVIPRLPLLRTGLVVITGIYLARGLLVIPAFAMGREINAFGWWSSLIVLIYGLAYLIGTWRAWPRLA